MAGEDKGLREMDRRKLYVERGFASLFDYCIRKMSWSESTAGRRIAVARAMEHYPVLYDLLLSGEVNLTTVGIVAGVLDEENHARVIGRIRGKSCREVDQVRADFAPQRETRDAIRALGRRGGLDVHSESASTTPPEERSTWAGEGASREDRSAPPETKALAANGNEAKLASGLESLGRAPAEMGSTPAVHGSRGLTAPAEPDRAAVTPSAGSASEEPPAVAEARYEMRFSVGAAFVENFEQVRSLLSGRFPRGARYEEVFAAVLEDFLERNDPIRRTRRRDCRRAKLHAKREAEARANEAKPREARAPRAQPGHSEIDPPGDGALLEPFSSPNAPAATQHVALREDEDLPAPDAPEPMASVGGQKETPAPGAPDDATAGRSRAIPRDIRDAVTRRDGGRCTYVSSDGILCLSRWDLEIDHIIPFCRGGTHDPANLRMRCSRHNLLDARRILGENLMATYTGAPSSGDRQTPSG